MPYDPSIRARRRTWRSRPELYERQPGEDTQCGNCGLFNMADAKFCDQCGQLLNALTGPQVPDENDVVMCPVCMAGNARDANACDQCGHWLPSSAFSLLPGPTAIGAAHPEQVASQLAGSSSSGRQPAAVTRQGTSAEERAAYLRGERVTPRDRMPAARADLMRGYRDSSQDGPQLAYMVARAEQLVKRCAADLDEAGTALSDAQIAFPDEDLVGRRHLGPEARERYGALLAAQEEFTHAQRAHRDAENLQASCSRNSLVPIRGCRGDHGAHRDGPRRGVGSRRRDLRLARPDAVLARRVDGTRARHRSGSR